MPTVESSWPVSQRYHLLFPEVVKIGIVKKKHFLRYIKNRRWRYKNNRENTRNFNMFSQPSLNLSFSDNGEKVVVRCGEPYFKMLLRYFSINFFLRTSSCTWKEGNTWIRCAPARRLCERSTNIEISLEIKPAWRVWTKLDKWREIRRNKDHLSATWLVALAGENMGFRERSDESWPIKRPTNATWLNLTCIVF